PGTRPYQNHPQSHAPRRLSRALNLCLRRCIKRQTSAGIIKQMSGISYKYSAANAEYSHRYLYPSVSRLLQNVPPGAVVMDAGCGNGSFLSLFQDRNWQLHGSDLSPTGIQIARKRFPNINFFLADGQTLYADFLKTVGPVDVVLSTEVIEH